MRRGIVALTIALSLAVIGSAQEYSKGTSGVTFNNGTIDSPTGTLTLGGTSNVTVNSNLTVVGAGRVGAGSVLGWSGRADMLSPADGHITLNTQGSTFGARIKVDALPTITSGFGTSPAITAGSTPFAGSVNVGTGGAALSGVVAFNGTAFPSAPFCVATTFLTNSVSKVTATTTQITLALNSGTAWTASDVVTWVCISAK